jgi:type II secretory ATPase GspE/PulE/Tfp pilus assembly ATPase PilB-like protein
MAEFPDVFPPVVRHLVAIGEETGSLGEAVMRAAETLETLEALPDTPHAAPDTGGILPAPVPEDPEQIEAGRALAETILEEAIRQRASDVHVQPLGNSLRVRYRVDGTLRTVQTVEGAARLALIARLKSMAKLSVVDRHRPQRGTLTFCSPATGEAYPLRVMTYPFAGFEGVTIRIHRHGPPFSDLTDLGMAAEQAEQCRRLLRQPCGLVAVAGAHGSGRTTTLYTLLRELHREGVAANGSVVTVEDPVEAPLESVRQVPLDPAMGLTAAEAIRGVMRQDTDILVLGDARDPQSVSEAVRAAARGRLVLVGVTAHDAESAREILSAGDPQQAPGQVLGIIVQRLVPKPCTECQGKGCDACSGSGYRGRTGVFEIPAQD